MAADKSHLRKDSKKTSVASVVQANAANWLKATKALRAQEKAKSEQYTTQSLAVTEKFKKVGFSGKNASTLKSDVGVNDHLYNENDVPVFVSPLETVVPANLGDANLKIAGVNDHLYNENDVPVFVSPLETVVPANLNDDLYLTDNPLTEDDESEIPVLPPYDPPIDLERQKIVQNNATPDGPFDKSLPPGGRDLTHTDAYLANEKAAAAALKNDANELMIAKHNVTHGTNYLKPIPIDVSDINSGTSYRSMHTDMDEVNGLKEAEMFANGGGESYYFETQDEDGNDISVLIENEAEEIEFKVDETSLFLQNSKDGLIAREREGIGFTVDEITSKAMAEAKAKGLEERKTMTAAEIDLISESLSEKSRRLVKNDAETYKGRGNGQAELDQLELIKNQKEKEKGRNPKNRFDSLREAAALAAAKEAEKKEKERLADLARQRENDAPDSENAKAIEKDKAEKLAQQKEQLAAEKKTKEQIAAHDKYQNDRIDNIANKSDADATYRKFQADEKAKNKLKKDLESADRIGSKMDRDNDRSFDPLIGGDPYAFSNFSYPLDVTNNNENGHYILFYVNVQNKSKYQYMTPKGVTVGDYVETPGYFEASSLTAGDVTDIPPSQRPQNKYVEATTSNSAAAGEIDYQRQNVKNGGKGNILHNNMKILQKSRKAPYAGINSRYPTTTRITDSVALYLPPGIGNTLGAKYGDAETGVAGYLVLSGIDIVNDVKNLDFAGATDKLFGVGGTIIKEAVKKIGITAFEGLTETSGLTQSFDKIFGQASNPYIEVVFDAMNMRTFEYAFSFAPTSARETDEVKAIIQLFRFHMAPEMKGAAHRYLTLPSTFDIHYMFQSGMDDTAVAKENSFFNKIATCVLTSVDINYTPNDEIQSFADGAPTQINMALSFKETEMLTKEKINDGF